LLWLANVALTLTWLVAWAMGRVAASFSAELSPLRLHIAMGSLATLLSLFASTCILFYFIGTGLWMRDQAKEIVVLDRKAGLEVWRLYEEANRLKAGPFAFATFGLALGLFGYILGGATHVGAIPPWVHPTLATLLVANNWIAQRFTFRNMVKNVAYLDEASDRLDAAEAAARPG